MSGDVTDQDGTETTARDSDVADDDTPDPTDSDATGDGEAEASETKADAVDGDTSDDANDGVDASDGDSADALPTDGVDASDSDSDATGDAVDASDEADGGDATDASDSGDTGEGVDASDSGDTGDGVDASDSGDTGDGVDASDGSDTGDGVDATDSGDAADGDADALDAEVTEIGADVDSSVGDASGNDASADVADTGIDDTGTDASDSAAGDGSDSDSTVSEDGGGTDADGGSTSSHAACAKATLGTPCPSGFCDGFGLCVACLDDAPSTGIDRGCKAGTPICLGGSLCVACASNLHCPAGLSCDPRDHVCSNCDSDSDCDDGFSCSTEQCVNRVCERVTHDDACDDGAWCNGAERCDPFALDVDGEGCVSRDEPDLDDDVACTVDFCNESDDAIGHRPEDARCPDLSPCATSVCSADEGCVVTPAPAGTLCDKDAGVCALGACLDCIDSGAGVDDGCGGANRFCVVGACAACVIDDDCPGVLTCEGGACAGCSIDAECDDGVACTNDVCDPETTACVHLVDDALCDNGLFCDGLERCLPESASADARGCIEDAVPTVDDGIACTNDACDEAANRVVHTPDRDLCDDGNLCTNESCSLSLGCLHQALVGQGPCDGDVGFCDAEGACAACVDDSVGGIDLGCEASAPACVGGGCVVCTAPGAGCPTDCAGVPGGASELDLCGTCDADPGNDCLGLCDGVPCGPICDGSVAGECDDGKPCTLDSCVAGRCKNEAAPMNGSVCDDQDKCTASSTCAAGVCVGTAQVVCGGPCQTGACDADTGCVAEPAGTECNDGAPGVCVDGGRCEPKCDDGNACTFDQWVTGPSGRTCVSEPFDPNTIPGAASQACSILSCDPGNGQLIETLDIGCATCAAQACDRPCYTGSCNAGGGCEPSPSGTPCDDDNDDTTGDSCDGKGSCFGTCPAPPECGTTLSFLGTCEIVDPLPAERDSCPEVDDNPCTVEYCSAEGTCERMTLPGHSCDHPCGDGVCSAAGTCELSVDRCETKLGACWHDVACDLTRGVCDGEPNDDYCRVPGAICDTAYGWCAASGTVCGDGLCDKGEARCWGDCWDSNFLSVELANETVGVYQGMASSAYGYRPAHQNVSLTRMLTDGVRWFHQVVDYCEPGAQSGELCVCEDDDKCPDEAVRLVPMLLEIGDYLEAHPETLVFMQFPTPWVKAGDLRAAFEQAGLLRETFAYAAFGALVPWMPLDRGTLINKNRRLVVFGPGFLGADQIYYAYTTYRGISLNDDPIYLQNALEATFLETGSGNAEEFQADRLFDCSDGTGTARSFQDPRPIVFRHVAGGPPSFSRAGCYNDVIPVHDENCPRDWGYDPGFGASGVFLTDFYNSSSVVFTRGIGNGNPSPYPDTCDLHPDYCLKDANCEFGECGPAGLCVACDEDTDCLEGEWCDRMLTTCRALQLDGTFCERDGQCESGRCNLICAACAEDDECAEGQFCDSLGRCKDLRPDGDGCTLDKQCQSDVCRLGFCTECRDEGTCAAGEYCALNALPGKSSCETKKVLGDACISNEACASGNCWLLVCRDCNAQEDCAGDEYCELDLGDPDIGSCLPKGAEGDACGREVDCLSDACQGGQCVEPCSGAGTCGAGRYCDGFACRDDKANGAACLSDGECQSDACYLGFCVECDDQEDCASDTFCSLSLTPGDSACIDRRAIGQACAQGFECASDACFLLECAECNSQDDCGPNAFCTLTPGNSRCVDKKAIGGSCASDFECADGNCWNLVCAACDEQSDCPADEYCTLNVIGPADSACAPKKDFGDACATGVECLNGGCILLKCAECSTDSQCAANEFCSALGECVPELDNGTICTRDAQCVSGHCPGGFCRECGTDAHCAEADHCGPAFTCIADVDNGVACLRDSVCASDHCVAGFCRECQGDANCPAAEHCSATFQCVPDLDNGSACTRDSICADGHCVALVCRECADDSTCLASDHCNGVNQCVDDFANGTACLSDSACTSGHCVAGFCRACESDANCPSSQHCNGLFQCEADVGNNQPCLRDSFCTTGMCISGFCAECQTDGDCAGSEYCTTLKECVPDHGNNGTCTRNAMCSTGICSAGFCAECTSNSHCDANEFCNAGGDCENRRADGLACTLDKQCLTNCCGLGKCGGGACP